MPTSYSPSGTDCDLQTGGGGSTEKMTSCVVDNTGCTNSTVNTGNCGDCIVDNPTDCNSLPFPQH